MRAWLIGSVLLLGVWIAPSSIPKVDPAVMRRADIGALSAQIVALEKRVKVLETKLESICDQ